MKERQKHQQHEQPHQSRNNNNKNNKARKQTYNVRIDRIGDLFIAIIMVLLSPLASSYQFNTRCIYSLSLSFIRSFDKLYVCTDVNASALLKLNIKIGVWKRNYRVYNTHQDWRCQPRRRQWLTRIYIICDISIFTSIFGRLFGWLVSRHAPGSKYFDEIRNERKRQKETTIATFFKHTFHLPCYQYSIWSQ